MITNKTNLYIIEYETEGEFDKETEFFIAFAEDEEEALDRVRKYELGNIPGTLKITQTIKNIITDSKLCYYTGSTWEEI